MIFSKLDLDDYLKKFNSFLARDKPIFMQGDTKIHAKMIFELQNKTFNQPPTVKNLDTQLIHLTKQGILHIDEIFEFVKIVNFMKYLQQCYFEEKLGAWLDKIVFPQTIIQITEYFDKKGEFKQSIDDRFVKIEHELKNIKEQIDVKIRQLFATKRLDSYLVDRQIHFLNDQETLLVRGGFNHILKATVIGRSSSGFFYVVPENLDKLKRQENSLLNEKQSVILEYCQKISHEFSKNQLFLKFLNREFDRFDHYSARVNFAKENDFEFVVSNKSSNIKIDSFCHPALNEPKAISVDFSGKVLMITGVNAGGKTMLLKSILSATLLAKYLLPMQINSANSSIGSFSNIQAIIQDPQNTSNDISTFAGRMLAFSKLFGKKNILVGVDEIELGTDADEAASLFFAIITKLMQRDVKIVITTHHKRLASLLAKEDGVELKAALYDEKLQRPTFEFLKGTIGKSYAFETAIRYKIPVSIVLEAKKVYGEDKENLNDLIQKNIDLELKMRKNLEKAKKEKELALIQKQKLKEEKDRLFKDYKRRFLNLEMEFDEAINEAKKAAKSKDLKQIHQGLNRAQNAKKLIKSNQIEQKPLPLKVGDMVKYGSSKGSILSIKKQSAIIESNGITLRVPLGSLKRSSFVPLKSSTSKINIQKPAKASVKLDLHGLRSQEAVDKLDRFISDALLSGFDEILVYHGIGTGKLSYAVAEFLKTHPSVVSFSDAPPSMGGFGAKVITL